MLFRLLQNISIHIYIFGSIIYFYPSMNSRTQQTHSLTFNLAILWEVTAAAEDVTTVENGLSEHQIQYLETVGVRAGYQLKYIPKVSSVIAQSTMKSMQLYLSYCLPMLSNLKLLCLHTCFYSIHIYILIFIFMDMYFSGIQLSSNFIFYQLLSKSYRQKYILLPEKIPDKMF